MTYLTSETKIDFEETEIQQAYQKNGWNFCVEKLVLFDQLTTFLGFFSNWDSDRLAISKNRQQQSITSYKPATLELQRWLQGREIILLAHHEQLFRQKRTNMHALQCSW